MSSVPAPASRQTLLFSATWPEAIAAISGRVQRDPLAIEIDSTDALPPIEQQFWRDIQQRQNSVVAKVKFASAILLRGVFAIPKKIAVSSATR